MEFTTPPSYGTSVVTVGAIESDGTLLFAGPTSPTTHTEVKEDDNDWAEPTAVSYKWAGKSPDGKDVEAELAGPFGPRLDRVDVMAEVPAFVKSIVATAAGTKPYIYQVRGVTKLFVQTS